MASYAAIDLGASAGRVLTGELADDRLALREVHRFPNRPVRLPDGLHWDLPRLFAESLVGLRAAGPVHGVGVDAWGVDYALLDDGGRVLGTPFHYRDGRTVGMAERAFQRVPREELYARTGTQVMPINTMFQLLADDTAGATRLALVPDLMSFWLTGELAGERTIASTTGLLDARTGEWALDLVERLGLPARLFGDLVEPGTALGPLLGEHELGPATVYAVAGHDTASAFVAAPLADEHSAILSSGTWSLLGVELPAPRLDKAARAENLTNERGVDGTIRVLRNVMGLWLVQECARTWNVAVNDLLAEAEHVQGEVPVFDPDREELLAPGDMPARIARLCGRALGRAELVRSILLSLACKYRLVLERLEAVTGREIRRIHVVGGGARAALLCRLTADVTGREVLAGPVEATGMGNVLVQARAAGELSSLAEMRAVAAASVDVSRYEPGVPA